jgi:hypothetical protein
MFGMVVLLILDTAPGLVRNRGIIGLFLAAIIGSFALLCAILLYLKIPFLVTLALGGSALLWPETPRYESFPVALAVSRWIRLPRTDANPPR